MSIDLPGASIHQLPDIDSDETSEWLDSLDAVIDSKGTARANYLLARLMERASAKGVAVSASVQTDYINSIPAAEEPWFPGDEFLERRIRAFVRWNAVMMVDRANHRYEGLGGHLSTYASAAALYEVGFNHFFRGKADGAFGDQIFVQGHAAPGMYARAYLEGRLTEEQLDRFRRETAGGGLPSYPHPRRLPDFWEFPTVSMGLGPLSAVYQARFNRYLYHHEIADTSKAKVWCFVGDGEMDEPESTAALSLAAREQLDNLIFVVNCNLQRLDGPVRGNGKVIQEFESSFRGAGWNVIKVIWGKEWDPLLAMDTDGVLLAKMNSTVDGEFQKYAVESGSYIREHFFGPDPRLSKMVEHLSDEQIERLPRGGHDYGKLYAAYKRAVEHEGSPSVILAKTIKGWTLGSDIEARNATHQIKKMSGEELKTFRDRLHLDLSDEQLSGDVAPYFHPGFRSAEYEYLMERRRRLDGYLPDRVDRSKVVIAPSTKLTDQLDQGSGKQAVSTTMAFTRLLKQLLGDKQFGQRVVPIISDEGRTFGMDALFNDVKIYAPFGQKYEPVDAGLLLSYREARTGRILEEGITEAGAMASFTAAGTAYSTWGQPMIPFFIFYSMFGFQRVGDSIWAFGDMRGKGFLMGATAGRTSLSGEGLQHCDGHSQLVATTVPNCRAYDPAFAYEVGVIVRDGIARMYGEEPEDCFYYVTLYNENYLQPPKPTDVDDAEIVRGLYRYRVAPESRTHRAQLLGSGALLNEVLRAQALLAAECDVAADVWSVTSWKSLREDALECERWNRLHPESEPRTPYITERLADTEGPVVASSDWMKAVVDQIGRFVPQPFVPLGTDGFGFSDVRSALRRHFEVDAEHVVVATLDALAQDGAIEASVVAEAIERYGINPEAPDPRRC
jgi:pyruvate dehydrogenase E1 component